MSDDNGLRSQFEKPSLPSNIYLAILYVLDKKPNQSLSDIKNSLNQKGFERKAGLGVTAMCIRHLTEKQMVFVSGTTEIGTNRYRATDLGIDCLNEKEENILDTLLPPGQNEGLDPILAVPNSTGRNRQTQSFGPSNF
ncbi:MAG: hypothetical protein KDJ75_04905 [Alphaproteobacteria bacterium]|nr:hypothetical protein [Alphaproteobacteria bacterium]